MTESERTLCIVPARGGSKGIARKNLRMVAGKPLFVWSVQQALACSLVDRVIVSTDDPEIAGVAVGHGAEAPFLRPAALAVDTAATELAMIHAVDWLRESSGYFPKSVLLLQPTCPVRKRGSIDRALSRFADANAESLVSVREIHPFIWRNEEFPQASYDIRNRPRRQDVAAADRVFEETGSIYVTDTELLLRSGNRLGGKIALFEMDAEESWDVDSEADLVVVNILLQRLMKNDHRS